MNHRDTESTEKCAEEQFLKRASVLFVSLWFNPL